MFEQSMGRLSLAEGAAASPSENAHQGRSLSSIASPTAPSPRGAERRGSTTLLQKPNPALPSIFAPFWGACSVPTD